MVLGIIGTAIAMGAISDMANRKGKKAYPKMNSNISNEMDAEFARYGIKGQNGRFDTTKIKMIAARNNVATDKHGVLPENGWRCCRSYVAKYANEDQDILDFEQAWCDTIQTQLNIKRRKISDPKNKALKKYKKHNRYFNAPSHRSEWQQQIIILELKHWFGIPKEEQIKRMQELQDQTYWGQLCAEPPILRKNPTIPGTYIEVWMLHASNKHQQGTKYTNSVFKDWYKECCTKLGYEHQL